MGQLGIRTHNLSLIRRMLYQLSYWGWLSRYGKRSSIGISLMSHINHLQVLSRLPQMNDIYDGTARDSSYLLFTDGIYLFTKSATAIGLKVQGSNRVPELCLFSKLFTGRLIQYVRLNILIQKDHSYVTLTRFQTIKEGIQKSRVTICA